jgi:hypothetical protein
MKKAPDFLFKNQTPVNALYSVFFAWSDSVPAPAALSADWLRFVPAPIASRQ